MMNKNRLEAFSDGVFAIVVTLLVLEIHVPEVTLQNLPEALIHILPRVLSYVMSFAVISLYWLSHHYYFDRIKKVNGTFVWLNILMLLLISFMPIPTALLGRYPLSSITLTIYGLNLIFSNLLGFLILRYVHNHPQLANHLFNKKFVQNRIPVYLAVNGAYSAAIFLSFFWPAVSYAIYLSVLLLVTVSLIKQMNKDF
jgi:uncharacterized membrane protein